VVCGLYASPPRAVGVRTASTERVSVISALGHGVAQVQSWASEGGNPTLPALHLRALELISIPGVMRILEDLQGQLVVVSEDEIWLLRKLCDANIAIERARYRPEGEIVEVVEGQLRGILGVFLEESKTTLLVPLHTLQTSVAVTITRAQVMTYTDGGKAPHLRPSLLG
jgi:hypothetical protein